jgi:diguanylate cyclase (GGDEF)-like protein
MSETIRTETELGIADLKKRLGAVGLSVIDQRERFYHDSTYFAVGNSANQTDIVLSREFLDDLPNTKDYHPLVDSYAHAVAGRLKCGSPELFYCRSVTAVQVSIRWPIQSAIYNHKLSTFVLMDVIRQPDGYIAKCSMEIGSRLGRTAFDIVIEAVNSVRSAIDSEHVKFYEPDFHQEVYQRIEHQQHSRERLPQPEIERFITGKAYILGFLAVDEPSDVWALDPWDAQYLGVTVKELSLAMRVLRAKGLLQPGSASDYVRPTDKLLAERSSEIAGESMVQSQQQLSRSNLPNKEELLKDVRTLLERTPTFALLVIDLDHFKSVNDTNGHSEGDACLDRVVSTIGGVVGRKGKIYRWGGDEFAVCLPDFSTGEAQATAERIRGGVEEAKPGGEIAVTTSIGVCGRDSTASKSAEELLDFADKAMYESKRSGKNRVTPWPLSSVVSKIENTSTERMGENERRKLADSVVLSVKTDNSQQRIYTILIKNHSQKYDVEVKRISLWSDGQRISQPVFRPDGASGKCWDIAAGREIPIGFDAGEVVAKRLWSIAGAPSMSVYHDTNLLLGHIRSKVRVEVLYEVLGIEKQYGETRTVQVDPINNAVTGV